MSFFSGTRPIIADDNTRIVKGLPSMSVSLMVIFSWWQPSRTGVNVRVHTPGWVWVMWHGTRWDFGFVSWQESCSMGKGRMLWEEILSWIVLSCPRKATSLPSLVTCTREEGMRTLKNSFWSSLTLCLLISFSSYSCAANTKKTLWRTTLVQHMIVLTFVCTPQFLLCILKFGVQVNYGCFVLFYTGTVIS